MVAANSIKATNLQLFYKFIIYSNHFLYAYFYFIKSPLTIADWSEYVHVTRANDTLSSGRLELGTRELFHSQCELKIQEQ